MLAGQPTTHAPTNAQSKGQPLFEFGVTKWLNLPLVVLRPDEHERFTLALKRVEIQKNVV